MTPPLHVAASDVRVVAAAGHHRQPGEARSYVGDGRLVTWRPTNVSSGTAFAVDAERFTRRPPDVLARRLGAPSPDVFWREWTLLEARCKVMDRPVVVALHEGPADTPAEISTTHLRLDDLILAFAVARPPGGGTGQDAAVPSP